jgi:pimeloyl-ACP methyl ester carboxylesterase
MRQNYLIPVLLLFTIICCKHGKEFGTIMGKVKYSSGYASVNGLKMYYEIHGEGGMPLLLIHGGGSTIETTFGNIIPSLASYGKVIAVELQAHGHTSDRNSEESFEQDADDVAGLLGFLKIEKADIFGFSNGGNTAMQVAIRHPEKVNKLIIASAFYRRDGFIPGFFEGMEHTSLENMPAPLKEAYLRVAPDKSHLQVMHDKDRDRMRRVKDWTDESLKSIKSKTLLIVGDHDVVTTEHTTKMSHLIPNASLMVLPGVHGSFIGEVCTVKKGSKIPDMTVEVVEEFLKGE